MFLLLTELATARTAGIVRLIRVVFCITLLHSSTSLAQIAAPITPSGLNTQVDRSTTPSAGAVQHDIIGGTRSGTNLFHSFGEFNVPTNHIANFRNDTGLNTSNILGRVTGGNISTVFGTIQTTEFGNANLFLMNPSGIIFGPDASLNVGGSVAFTTADYLRLADNGRFNAIPNALADALLSAAPVAAYGFLGSDPGFITVTGSQLTVPAGKGISFIGGNIAIQNGTLQNGTVQPARLSSPNGQINLATARSPGEFLQNLPDEHTGPSVPNVNGVLFKSFGSVHLTSGSTVDVQTGRGKISIRGGQLVLEIQNSILETADNSTSTAIEPGQSSIILAPKSSIISQAFLTDPGPTVHIMADQIKIIGIPGAKETFSRKPFTGIRSESQGAGNAGDIILETTGNIETSKVVNLQSFTHASGKAGNVSLTSRHGNIRMTEGNQEAQGFSWTSSKGDTGDVTASAREGDIVLHGVVFYTLSQETGRAGHVAITAKNLWMNSGALGNTTVGNSVKPGGITVELSGKLTMTADSSGSLPPGILPDSLIFTASTSSSPAADINITAKDILVTQGSNINSAAFADGPGGHLKIAADTLQVTDGAQISSGSTKAPNRGILLDLVEGKKLTGDGGNITIRPNAHPTNSIVIDGARSGIFANTEGTGTGGTINLSAKTLTIQNGGTISASTTGNDTHAIGGSIVVNATDQVALTNGSSITATSKGPADAGTISINAGQQLDVIGTGTNRSSITTEAKQAKGGDINIQAVDRLRVVDGEISTSVLGGAGSGGNITIDPKIVLLQNSEILAQANRGTGGDISITTPVFIADQSSRVDASTPFGLNGRLTIQSPTSNLSGTVGQLVSKTSPPQVLLQNRCVALAGGEQSTFLLAGRETLPVEPSGWLSSPVSMEHWTGEEAAHASRLMVRNRELNSSAVMTAQTSRTPVLSLRRLTPPGFLVRTFAPGVTGCPS